MALQLLFDVVISEQLACLELMPLQSFSFSQLQKSNLVEMFRQLCVALLKLSHCLVHRWT
jgi:hypothetical protein